MRERIDPTNHDRGMFCKVKIVLDNHLILIISLHPKFSEVPNWRTDRNKQAGGEKCYPAHINEQDGIFCLYMKNCKEDGRKSENFKRACTSIRDFKIVVASTLSPTSRA